MRYNLDKLFSFCNENSITLSHDYSNTRINRETTIEGCCKESDCYNQFNKNFRQLVKSGPYCNICCNHRGFEKIKNKLCKFNLEYLIKHCSEHNITLKKNYEYVNRDTVIIGLCKTEKCENMFSKSFRELLKLGAYCFQCTLEKGKTKIIETCMKNYGVSSSLKSPEIRKKITETTFEKYGVYHNSQNQEIKEKKKQINLKNYGVEYSLQAPEVRNKILQTNIEKFGVDNPQKNNDIKKKTEEIILKKYGCKCFFQTESFKNKIIETNIQKYGVPHHMQNAEISEKNMNACYKTKYYTMPSGKIISYQGYENFAIDYLLKVEKLNENDIVTKRTEVPELWFYKNDKKCRHYVDFFIKSQNRCLEVKSSWTFSQKKNTVFEKQEAAKQLGYIYEIWVYEKNGTIKEKYI